MAEKPPTELSKALWFLASLVVMLAPFIAVALYDCCAHPAPAPRIDVPPMTPDQARDAVRTVCGRPPTLLVPDGEGAAVIDRVEDAVYVGANGATLAIVGTGQVRCAVCATLGAGDGAWILFDDVPKPHTLGRWQGQCIRRAVPDNLSIIYRLPGGERYRAAAAAQTRQLRLKHQASMRRGLLGPEGLLNPEVVR